MRSATDIKVMVPPQTMKPIYIAISIVPNLRNNPMKPIIVKLTCTHINNLDGLLFELQSFLITLEATIFLYLIIFDSNSYD